MTPNRGAVGAFLLAGLLVSAGEPAVGQTVNCASCHASQSEEHARSVHREMRCQECHQGAAEYPAPAGGPSVSVFDHGDGFLGKPARVDVPKFCGACHEDVVRMNPYGLRTDPLSRYWTSNHGQRIKANDARAAVCTDCHGRHLVLPGDNPQSSTYPLNIPDTCATCHANAELMAEYGLTSEVVSEYKQSVHGRLLFDQHDTGAPTCATCHDNHAAVPPGFASVGHVCGKCHTATAENFEKSVHAKLDGFKQCLQCHGGGPERHSHMIEKITKPAGVLIQRYAHLLRTSPKPTDEQIAETLHADPREIISRVLPSCEDCHEAADDPESSVRKLFGLLNEIARAEKNYAQTGQRLDEVSRGVLLVEKERFEFQDAKTHLVALAPLQHTLDIETVRATAREMEEVCDRINQELDQGERGLRQRRLALIPVFAFSLFFSALLYAKFRVLKRRFVRH